MTKRESRQIQENESNEEKLRQAEIERNDANIEKNRIMNELNGLKARKEVFKDQFTKLGDQLKDMTQQKVALTEINESLEVRL